MVFIVCHEVLVLCPVLFVSHYPFVFVPVSFSSKPLELNEHVSDQHEECQMELVKYSSINPDIPFSNICMSGQECVSWEDIKTVQCVNCACNCDLC